MAETPNWNSIAGASLIKGMLARGDRQSDIAAWFQTNGGRICEINKGYRHPKVKAAPPHVLPPAGPYTLIPRGGAGLPIADELRAVLQEFAIKWMKELAQSAHERRQTNEKIDMLMRQQLELRRDLGTVERPRAPRTSRRKPLE